MDLDMNFTSRFTEVDRVGLKNVRIEWGNLTLINLDECNVAIKATV